ncbi:MAG: sodium:alanine symporter family protein [Clostridia bacterium]|nr:sodium:alanine symporter family protein [Clostridia bacterium]
MNFTDFLKSVDDVVWGIPLIVLILLTGIFLTIRTKGISLRKLGISFKYMLTNEEGAEGEVTSFGAFCTAMAATIGTGNIVGVATAVVAGGPGALFWMIFAGLIGMATKYAEGVLAVKYRTINIDGHALGGPFYYIEKGMGEKWKWLAKVFAVFGVGAGFLGIGTFTQVNGIASAIQGVCDPNKEHVINIFGTDYSISIVITAVVLAIVVARVIIGGIQRITKVTTIVVPFMAISYIVVALAIIINNIDRLPGAIALIFQSAFGLRAVAGGALGAIMIAMQKGIARGIFSNEAGLGSAPIAAAAAQTKSPVREGLVQMTGTFIDTIIVCTLTGLVLVVTGTLDTGLEGAQASAYAFGTGLPWNDEVGSVVLAICLTFFAFTTILGWDYYSERCLEYLVGYKKKILAGSKWIYVLCVLIGPFLTLEAVWTLADIFNGLMAIPNLIALLALSGVVAKETKEYLDNTKSNKLK